MSTKVAPWLQGLDEAWETPAGIPQSSHVSSASHDAGSLGSNNSRAPRRSLSGLPSSLGSQKTTSQATTQIKRSPLAPLSHSNTNTFRKQNGTIRMTGTRSVSEASDGSQLFCGTVQQRAKSTSPTKKQETLEWKRRLVAGQVAYGDQTDLFGPSGLDNIFARSSGPENDAPKPKKRMSWLQNSNISMPSSPPAWPSRLGSGVQSELENEDPLEPVDEELQSQDADYEHDEEDGSFRSTPFDLARSDDPNQSSPSPRRQASQRHGEEMAGNRTVSGQTELEQEDFSPVYISKHTTITGQVNYAALDSHLVKQFNSMKVDLRHPSQEHDPTLEDDSREQQNDMVEQSAFTDGPESEGLPTAPDLSLSENLPTGTPPVASLGRNIEFARGGYSAYGSFKHRPLSPSPSKLEESQLPEESQLLSPSVAHGRPLPAAPFPPPAPTTPLRPTTPGPPKSRSSGSPLKLFGPHDTFTNNRLLRRMSQLDPDGNPIKEPIEEHDEAARVPSVRREVSYAASQNSFGSGHYDSHAFNAEITITSASDSDKFDSDQSPGSEIPPPGGRDPLNFKVETSPGVRDTYKLKRKLSKHSAANSKSSTLEGPQKTPLREKQATVEDVSELDAYYQRAEQVKSFDGGKRPPTSPFKNPTPKRRRTLHASELEDHVTEASISYHLQIQEVVSSRKRKDARPGDLQDVADPDILASRKILRPRNPTPSQRRQQQIEAELREAAEEFAAQKPERLEAVMEHIESSMAGTDGPPLYNEQARALAAEVANFTLKVQKPSGEHGVRKRSITTQDFMNEAVMVMQLIRAKARPQSGLGSVEESDAEEMGSSLLPDVSVQSAAESLRVSRPPSREGRHSGWRSNAMPQTDPRVVSHLRRFEERNDTEFIADSIATLRMDDEADINDNVSVYDEQSNIRITGPPAYGHATDGASDESRPVSQHSQGSTLQTQQSADNSTGRTTGTNSTRKSENVGTLAPTAVAHLIGEQVGGMTFDKAQQRWVRVKSPEKKKTKEFLYPPSNLTSDDDPFREISDLPVDEQTELRRISSSGKTTRAVDDREDEQGLEHTEVIDQAQQQPVAEARTSSTETVISRPVTRDNSHMQGRSHHAHSSSVPSRYSAFASSQQQDKIETRATSYSDEEYARMTAMDKARHEPLAYAAAQATLALRGEQGRLEEEPTEDVNEISSTLPPAQTEDLSQESTIPQDDLSPLDDDLRDDTYLDQTQAHVLPIASPKLRQNIPRPINARPAAWQEASREVSLRRKTLTNKFTGGQRELSDLSLVAALPGDRMLSLSMSVSRPVSTRQQSGRIAELQSSPIKGNLNSTFLLSDLPDFTVHEVDEEKPSERALAQRLAQHAAAEVDDRYALAVKDLVKTLTDVQEDEPYWEDIKELDLRDRSLASIYGLDDFCTQIQRLDVSGNALTQLHGASSTTRIMDARYNQLSCLTSWHRLMNLQYLDVSGNQLDSLKGLCHLVHLRELRADDNLVTSLDGLQELDGLLKLRLRRNKIQRLDLEGFQLHRLTELDVAENNICAVERLEVLPNLLSLTLDGNLLHSPLRIQHELPKLKVLSVQRCGLESLHLSGLSSLRYLYADDNSLGNIKGLAGLRNLECLSLRRQHLLEGVGLQIFDHPLEARCIHLSGNKIATLELPHTYLNIQELELASVGLQDLPADFGLRMPNLRRLNLNFNSLRDIRPLLNISKLEHLTLCGNRLDRLRKSVATLAKLSSLKSVDLRDNPVTQGFYAPILPSHTSIVRRQDLRSEEQGDEGADALELAKHTLPRGDQYQDHEYQARADEETKLRRRVYELLLAHNCTALRELDGLAFDKSVVGRKDSVWERLVELGVVRKSEQSPPSLSEA